MICCECPDGSEVARQPSRVCKADGLQVAGLQRAAETIHFRSLIHQPESRARPTQATAEIGYHRCACLRLRAGVADGS
jgi:hypothetical protein